MMFTYDPENLIDLVKKRPGLWDNKHPKYKLKAERNQLWNELVTELLDPDINIDKTERRGLVIQLQKKWKGLKDTYAKAVKAKKTYVHNKRLRFLLKDKQIKGTSDDGGGGSDENSHVSDGESKSNHIITYPMTTCKAIRKPRLKRIKTNPETDEDSTDKDDEYSPPKKERSESTEFICTDVADVDMSNDKDPDKMFLVSLLPDLKEIHSSQRLNVKLELMQVLQKYKSQMF